MTVSQLRLAVCFVALSAAALLCFTGECSAIPSREATAATGNGTSVGSSFTQAPGSDETAAGATSDEPSTTEARTTEEPSGAVQAPVPVKPKGAAESGKPVQLFNTASEQFVFVSRDKLGSPPDDVAKAHKLESAGEARTLFLLQSVGNDRYRLYNEATKQRLFVSNDRLASDRVVEARKDLDEERTEFEFVSAGNSQYYIYNPSYGEYLFVSSNIIEGENVLQSRPSRGEERNKFELLQS